MTYPIIKDKHLAQAAVLVASCDNYSDVWSVFFELYHRFWPDNPLNTYLLTNFLEPNYKDVQILNIGEDISWSDNLLSALQRISEEYIFLFIEDLLLIDFVRTTSFEKHLSWAIEHHVNYLRFNPSTAPNIALNNEIGIVSPHSVYRTSVVASLWKKEVLEALLKKGENAWEFEHHGAVRSDRYNEFYSTYSEHFPVVNSIIKRVWERSAIKKLQRLGININPKARKVMTISEGIVWKCKLLRSKIFSYAPHRFRRSIKRFFQRDNYKF